MVKPSEDSWHVFFYLDSPLEFVLVLVLALVFDAVYPYHSGPLLLIHPVHTSYRLARFLHRPYSSKLWGVMLAIIVIVTHMALYASLLVFSGLLWEPLHVLVGAWIVKMSIGNKLLVDTVENVRKALVKGDLMEARKTVSGLVRRDTNHLGEEHVASAAIESLAESLVDGLISPLFYYFIAGPLGALLQRIINTLDGAVGFLQPEYAREGWFSARLDTIMNYVPARLVSFLAILLCSIGNFNSNLACLRKWAGKTQSINAGHPMSAFACCLNVSLEKKGAYRLGEGSFPSHFDIMKAVGLYRRVLVASLIVLTSVGLVLRLCL